jgi:tetratricopeptide (TPR) repeat protein
MAAGAVALALLLSTVFQSLIWADELSLYSHAVQVAPNSRNVKINLANVACERGLYQAGIKLYKDVIERYPDYWLTYYDLGYTYYKLGNLEEADRCFRRVAEFNILSANGFLYLGLIRLKMGRVNEAVPYLRHAAEVAEEGSPGYHFALGTVLKVQGDLAGALNEYKEELIVEPEQKAAREQIVEIEKLLRNPGRPGSPAKAQVGGTKRGVAKEGSQ